MIAASGDNLQIAGTDPVSRENPWYAATTGIDRFIVRLLWFGPPTAAWPPASKIDL
jgi:hypothetical protein